MTASQPPGVAPTVEPTEDHEEEDERGAPAAECRVCWEKEPKAHHLVSPCQCTGTQKHVHLRCLRRWQENVLKRDATDERAFRCSVCRALFSLPPPKQRSCSVAVQALRGIGGALCISLLAFGLSGPPWPHIALLVLLLLGSRSHWLPGVALVVVASTLACLHARGLRVVLRVDGGGRLGLALIRHGAPVQGVGTGVLLVASDGLEHSMFRHSVVLLTHHGRGGARGVMLTQPMSHAPPLPASLAATAAAATTGGGQAQPWRDSAQGEGWSGGGRRAAERGGRGGKDGAGRGGEQGVALRHYLGGPVGMPGEGVHHELIVLHNLPGVAGTRLILPAGNDTHAGGMMAATKSPGGNSGSSAAGDSSGGHQRLYEGGGLSEVMQRAAEAAAPTDGGGGAQGHRQRDQRAGGGGGVVPPPKVLLFHGICAWAEGQLEGELRAGAWGYLPAEHAPGVLSLLGMPPDQLWQALAISPHLDRAL